MLICRVIDSSHDLGGHMPYPAPWDEKLGGAITFILSGGQSQPSQAQACRPTQDYSKEEGRGGGGFAIPTRICFLKTNLFS